MHIHAVFLKFKLFTILTTITTTHVQTHGSQWMQKIQSHQNTPTLLQSTGTQYLCVSLANCAPDFNLTISVITDFQARIQILCGREKQKTPPPQNEKPNQPPHLHQTPDPANNAVRRRTRSQACLTFSKREQFTDLHLTLQIPPAILFWTEGSRSVPHLEARCEVTLFCLNYFLNQCLPPSHPFPFNLYLLPDAKVIIFSTPTPVAVWESIHLGKLLSC